jgi:CDP-diacylglycerol---serine O-phosphatidyltransferase
LLDYIGKSSANLITLVNIIFGSLSLISTLHGNFKMAAVFILLAVVMDALDGRIARKLGIISDMGKELDSLCDLVSFGVAPALLLYSQVLFLFPLLAVPTTVLYIMCGAFRLARFNVLNIADYFVGVPITAAGALLAVISLLADLIPGTIILILVLILAYMMVSKIKVRKY